MGRLLITVLAVGLGAMLPVSSAAAQATCGLCLRSQSAVFDPDTGQVTFRMVFTKVPDFETRDEFGRPAEGFQYYIVGDRSLPYPRNFDTIIRQEEIGIPDGMLRIRNAYPSDPDPRSGGWGTIRADIPYQLDRRVLIFSVDLGVVSDHSTDGHFNYELQLGGYGGITQFLRTESTVGPLRPTKKRECRNGGWRIFAPAFKNKRQCLRSVATAPSAQSR
jgi:hypothetical protein